MTPEEFRVMQTRELNNGRLGMLAAIGFLAQEAATGTTWGQGIVPAVMTVSPIMKSPGCSKIVQSLVSEDDTKFCYGLPGTSVNLGEFDPLNRLETLGGEPLSKLEVYRMREAELTHGRVAMLAAVGFIVQEKFHPLFNGIGGTASAQLSELPPGFLNKLYFVIFALEVWRMGARYNKANPFELKEDVYPGDLGFDPLGLTRKMTPEEFRVMQTRELNNGRLGMLAAIGFLAQEAATGTTWGASLM
jgi:hypothetical protein